MPPSRAESVWAGVVATLDALVQQPVDSPAFSDNSAKISLGVLALGQLPTYKPAELDVLVDKLKVSAAWSSHAG